MTILLENPILFDLWNRITGDITIKKKIISDFIRPFPGAKILDIGCGTGAFSQLIQDPSVSYIGVDLNPAYIKLAKKRKYPGLFYCEDAATLVLPENEFDIVLALDSLHHMDDEHVRQVLSFAKKCLKPNGRFVSIEPVITQNQPLLEKQLMKLDRGKHIRTIEANLAFFKEAFPEIHSELLNSYFIPWTECVFVCK